MLAFASVLIGVCFLPIRWSVPRRDHRGDRGGLHRSHARRWPADCIPDGVWAIVASIFMFRMMIYLYELKHARKPESLLDTLCYFFLLPNYCFMHFPVVDYRTMQRGYFAEDVHTVQRRGLDMMFRGTIHLLCYRLVYHELLIPASKVHDPVSLAGYLVCNYLLYLQVSGQFHMAAGMLHLFGFQLPQTHHHYLLATSFTDYWRRINIYWKDFMVRLFFNPVVFRLKRWPQPLALALATSPSSWPRGSCTPTSGTGCAEAGGSGFPTPSSGESSGGSSWSMSSSTHAAADRAARRARGTVESRPRRFLAQSRRHLHHRRAFVVAVVQPQPVGLAGHDSSRDLWIMSRDLTRQILVMILILLCGIVPDRLAGLRASSLRDSLKSNLFNRADLERIERGYYEELLDQGRRLDDLADVPTLRARWRSGSTWSIPVDQSPLVVRVDDLREVVLTKNDTTTRFGLEWRTNAQGMRDREYSLKKPPGHVPRRLGGRFDRRRLGSQRRGSIRIDPRRIVGRPCPCRPGGKVEIINCAVPGHAPGQRWYHFGQIGWPMEPDLVIYESTAADIGWDERRLRFLLVRGLGWDCPIYRAALENAGVATLRSPDQYKRALQPRHWEILSGVYRFMTADCRARGVPIFWVLVPRVGRRGDAESKPALIATARSAGFSGIIDLTDAFDGLDPAHLTVDRDDFHPNAIGHTRLAERLDDALKTLPEVARIWDKATGSEGANGLARARESRPELFDEKVKATSFAPTGGGPPQ